MNNNNSHSQTTQDYVTNICNRVEANMSNVTTSIRENPNVKRGLRNSDGTGVMIGYTQVGNVLGYSIVDGERVPMDGHLSYAGYDIMDLVDGYRKENRFGFEEVAYLLLLGKLPTEIQLSQFKDVLLENMTLPDNFTEDMILKHPSSDIMNQLGRSVLALYSSDATPDSTAMNNMVRQSVQLIARFPTIIAHSYAVKRHYFDQKSLFLHRPIAGLSIAENFLRAIRPDKQYTEEEAKLLDLCLCVHAEHGGGNNSTFTCRVLSSSGTDTYSAISGAIGSLKGPKHGGANRQVMNQFTEIKEAVKDWNNEEELSEFLRKILRKEVSDKSGLIYGMGHAIYTVSDPRTLLLKDSARSLAAKKGMSDEFQLLESIERLTPQLFAEVTGKEKAMCANVDMYSGLIYTMLGIPKELFTPVFAMARITGWCAHRLEEVVTGGRIIRPAYKALFKPQTYTPLDKR